VVVVADDIRVYVAMDRIVWVGKGVLKVFYVISFDTITIRWCYMYKYIVIYLSKGKNRDAIRIYLNFSPYLQNNHKQILERNFPRESL